MTEDGKQVQTRRTVATRADYIAAAAVAMDRVWGHHTPEALAMFWAMYQHETGGKNCWCWNTGNAKKFVGDGHDWCFLNGVWECYPDEDAQRMIASGEAKANTVDWRKCSPGRTVVVFEPPHSQCRFRAFETLERALYEHQMLILDRFPACWPHALAGDVGGFVAALAAGHYFTGDAGAYARGMRAHYVLEGDGNGAV